MSHKFHALLLSSVLLACGSCVASAAGGDRPNGSVPALPRWEAGIQYDFVHTNAPPGGCGCFSMNGGAGSFGAALTEHWAAVGEIAAQHASNVDGSGQDLTLTSYLVGPRYQILPSARTRPFAQLLFGAAHASGSYAPGTADYPGSSNAFAMAAGGGLSISLSPRVVIHAPEVDYYLTRFNNSVNDHQNNLRVSAGLSFRFGRR